MRTADDAKAVLLAARGGTRGSALRAVATLRRDDFAWKAKSTVRFLRNFTLEPIQAELELAGFQRETRIVASFADHEAYAPEILDPASTLHRDPPDLVILALWLDAMPLAVDPAGAIEGDRLIAHVTSLVDRLREGGAKAIALNTFLPPIARVASFHGAAELARVNLAIHRMAEADVRISVVDLGRLVERVGEDWAYDRRYWFLYRAPLARDLLALWAEELADLACRINGVSRKVLVLDADGCLWGGVVGEDGQDGIQLGPDSAFHVFQQQVLALQRAGVLLAVASKNEEGDVLRVLDEHPYCLLRREHLATHRIGWRPKSEGLRSIAEELHVGLDSLVFIDDSPSECAEVLHALPMVEVLLAPKEACDLPLLLQRYRGFSAAPPTAEDEQRTRMLRVEREREKAKAGFTDLESFLRSLELRAEIGAPLPADLPRVAQLTQRTNQHNLTTRRYELHEIASLAASPDHVVLGLRSADRFGEHGLTGVAVASRNELGCRIDALLLSCRVLGRRLEDALLAELLRTVRERWGEVMVEAEYLRTDKNRKVERFFDERGFRCTAACDEWRAYVLLPGDAAARTPEFIQVERSSEWNSASSR